MHLLGHDVTIMLTEKKQTCVYEIEEGIEVLWLTEWMENHKKSAEMVLGKVKRSVEKRVFVEDSYRKWKQYFQRKADGLTLYLKLNPTDIVYSFLVDANIVLGMASIGRNIITVAAERNYPERVTLEDDVKRLRNKYYSKADICVFQTSEQERCFASCNLKRTEIIPNPVKEDLPKPYAGRRKKVIVNFSGLRSQKNLPLLIHAFYHVHQDHPDYQLHIYGKGEQKEFLNELIHDLQLEDSAFIFDFRTDIHEVVNKLAIFVLSSDFEGMPNSLLEAMALGMPVVATDCQGGGARALIQDGYNGRLVPIGDEEAMYIAIKELIENPETAVNLGRNASKIREELSVKTIAEKWLALSNVHKDI